MTKNSGVNDIPHRVVITYYRAVSQSCKESINSLKSFITFNIVMLYIREKYFLHRITYSIHKTLKYFRCKQHTKEVHVLCS